MTAARPAVAEVVPGLSTAKPHANVQEVFRLNDCEGLAMWTHMTAHPLSVVLEPGYWDWCSERRGGGLAVHDRLIITAASETSAPEHCVLVVTHADPVRVQVKLLEKALIA